MEIISSQKETSERSEEQNWPLLELSASKLFLFSGFEGCNENNNNLVTTLLDRASIKINGDSTSLPTDEEVWSIINSLEGACLQGKIMLCERLGVPYSYILYNYDYSFVLRYTVLIDRVEFEEKYNSFEAFSNWVQTIKGWTSSKDYKEIKDLPEFDKALRTAGCPWPTNIDCVAFDKDTDNPVAIIEFQNAKKTTVRKHMNNSFFLPTSDYPGKDDQRWRSQEIIRLQSGLPHLTIVWSQNEDSAIVKLLHNVAFPDYSDDNQYAKALKVFNQQLSKDPLKKRNSFYESIRGKYKSYSLGFYDNKMQTIFNNPPLSFESHTFPFLYGKRLKTLSKTEFLPYIEKLLLGFIQN